LRVIFAILKTDACQMGDHGSRMPAPTMMIMGP
jgi:hypothetical protein